jgi:hypothetical protein
MNVGGFVVQKKWPYLLGGHFTKHNNSSAESRHLWVLAFCFQNAYINFLKLFFYAIHDGYQKDIHLV